MILKNLAPLIRDGPPAQITVGVIAKLLSSQSLSKMYNSTMFAEGLGSNWPSAQQLISYWTDPASHCPWPEEKASCHSIKLGVLFGLNQQDVVSVAQMN